mgnify:CR=1 FL=1
MVKEEKDRQKERKRNIRDIWFKTRQSKTEGYYGNTQAKKAESSAEECKGKIRKGRFNTQTKKI